MSISPYTIFKGPKKDINGYLWEVYNAGKIFMLRANKLYQLHYNDNTGFNFTVLYTADKKTNYCGRDRHLFVNAAACNHILGFNLIIDLRFYNKKSAAGCHCKPARKDFMTKTKMTSKALKNMCYYELSEKKVFSVGYCTLQSLLYFHSPSFYTYGVYGWNYDCYIIDGYVINTGYRGMFGYSVDYNLSREYELKAKKIIYDNSIDYEKQKELVNNLLMEYLQKATLQA